MSENGGKPFRPARGVGGMRELTGIAGAAAALSACGNDDDGDGGTSAPLRVEAPIPTLTAIATTDLPVSIPTGHGFMDPDGDTLSYGAVVIVNGVGEALSTLGLSIDENTGLITGAAFIGTADALIEVTVSDGRGGSLNRTLLIEANARPVENEALDDETATIGAAVNIPTGHGFMDPDGDTLIYDAVAIVNGVEEALSTLGLSIDESTGLITATMLAGTEDAVIAVTASDGRGGEVTRRFDIDVNKNPMADSLSPIKVSSGVRVGVDTDGDGVGDGINVSGVFSDPDGDDLTFSGFLVDSDAMSHGGAQLRNIGLAITEDGLITGAVTSAGDVGIVVVASDGRGGEVRKRLDVDVNENPCVGNLRMVGVPTSGMLGGDADGDGVGDGVDVSGAFMDPDGDALVFSAVLAGGAALRTAGLGISDEGLITGVIASAGKVVVEVTARDGRGGMATGRLEIVSNDALLPPLKVSNGERLGTDPGMDGVDVSDAFIDPDGDAPTFSAVLAGGGDLSDVGLKITGTGVISGAIDSERDVIVEVTATHTNGNSETKSLSIDVNEPVKVVMMLPDEHLHHTDEANIDTSGAFWDPDGDILLYGATLQGSGDLITRVGLEINSYTGVITGMFTGAEDVTINISVLDFKSNPDHDPEVSGSSPVLQRGDESATQSVVIRATNQAPTVDQGIPDQIVRTGDALNLTIPEDAFADANGDTLTYGAVLVADDDSTVPIGATGSDDIPFALDGDTLTSTLDASHAGRSWTLRVTASDGARNVSADFDVAIPLQTGARTTLPFWLGGAEEYGIGRDNDNVYNPINGVHSLTEASGAHWEGRGKYNTPTVLTYSFVNIGTEVTGWVSRRLTTTMEFEDPQKDFIRGVFDLVQSLSGVTFTEVSEDDSGKEGDIRITLASTSEYGVDESTLGFANFPGRGGVLGDIYIVNDHLTRNDLHGPFEAAYSRDKQTFTHELLHALGLSHPFTENGRLSGFHGYYDSGVRELDDNDDGVKESYDKDLSNRHGVKAGGGHDTPLTDTLFESLMTYHDPFRPGKFDVLKTGTRITAHRNTPWEPGIYDIAALQHLYGVNTDTESGDTTYDFNSDEIAFKTIWDGGGTDTITHSGSRSAVIDLNPEGESTLGFFGKGTYPLSAEVVASRIHDVNAADAAEATWVSLSLGEASDGLVSILDDRKIATFTPNLAADGLDEHFTLNYELSIPGMMYPDLKRGSIEHEYPGDDGGGFVDREYTTHNVTIAHGVVIENAVGGDGDDLIIGNSADNELTGGGGDDTFVIAANPVAGTDTIKDFMVGDDMIEFVDIAASEITFSGVDGGNFVFIAQGMNLTLEGVTTELSAGTDYLFVSMLA